MSVPEGLRYSQQHEWLRVEGSIATVGITAHAAEALGDIVFVQLPDVDAVVTAGEACGEIESTKSVSDLYAPVTGRVTEINDALEGAPQTVGEAPLDAGWLFRVELSEPGQVEQLLSSSAYQALIEEDSA